ncbi:hypothetical protein [Lysobacter gummosus]|uniref:hypothetical protein n=1 Tax=Lysobacter gummosus TaxID=262324 RepID=UPI00362C54DA
MKAGRGDGKRTAFREARAACTDLRTRAFVGDRRGAVRRVRGIQAETLRVGRAGRRLARPRSPHPRLSAFRRDRAESAARATTLCA